MGKKWFFVIFALLLILVACSPASSKTKKFVQVKSTPTLSLEKQKISKNTAPEWEKEPKEKIKTSQVNAINPYKGKVWNQYCQLVRNGGLIVDVKCAEDRAMEYLPGGNSLLGYNLSTVCIQHPALRWSFLRFVR